MKKLNATTVYLIYNSSTSLFFAIVFTVNLIYQATIVNLNPLELVLVGTVLETAIFLFEVPTGVVADVYSRRLSIIIGVFLIGAGFILEGSFPYFGTVLACQILWGIGYTFTSGATAAWISDEVGEEVAGRAFLRGSQAGLAGGLLGTVISVVIGSIRVNIPIIVGGALFLVLGIFLIAAMPEHGFTPKLRPPARLAESSVFEDWQGLLQTLRNGVKLVRSSRGLVMILLIGLFFGLYSEGYDRLWTPHLLRDFVIPSWYGWKPVVWFGLINIVGMLLGIGGTELARRGVNPDNHRISLRFLLADSAFLVAGLAVFALTQSFFLGLAAIWTISLTRTLQGPYFTAWVNRQLTSEVRATVLSMTNQVDSLGQILVGPLIGVIGNSVSIQAALIGSTVLLSPVLVLFLQTIRREERTPIVS